MTERVPVLFELGRLEITQDEAAGQDHLQEVLETRGDPAVRAQATIWLSRAALTWGRPDWAATTLQAIDDQLGEADAERALELEAEALTLTRVELSLRHLADDRLARFERRAAGHPHYEAVARIHAASERVLRGEPAAEVADEIEAALAAGPPADPYTFGTAIEMLVRTERDDAAGRWLDLAIEAARAYGLGLRLAGLHVPARAPRAGPGSRGRGRGERPDGAPARRRPALHAPEDRRRWPIHVALERGEIETAVELVERYGDALARERSLADEYLVSRGRLRIARGDVRAGLEDLLRCGELLDSYGDRAVDRLALRRGASARRAR